MITIKQITTTDTAYTDVYNIREGVLRKPLGLSLKDEDLSSDSEDIILLAEDNGMPVGCVMLKPKDVQTMKMRQMAVIDSYQGSGVGAQLVTAAEAAAVAAGYRQIILHARTTATGFYQKLGYNAEGSVFKEVGIPHLHMQKSLL